MSRFRLASRPDPGPIFYAALLLIAAALTLSPARAQTTQDRVVRAVLFTNPVCTWCRQIVEQDLPPAVQKFGSQLELLVVDVNTDEGKSLYEAALQAYSQPRGVPLLFVGESTLMGVNIVPGFPPLIETSLASGGLDWPAIPGLAEYLSTSRSGIPAVQAANTPLPAVVDVAGVVHATLFWMEGCPHCHAVIENVLPPLQEKYAEKLAIELVEVVSLDDVNQLYALGAAYGLSREQTGVPLLLIGEHVLTGAEQIPVELPRLIEQYLVVGGVASPDTSAYYTPVAAGESRPAVQPDGYGLALGVLVFLFIALLYSLAASLWKQLPLPPERWAVIALPLLALAGLGVAIYLSYVETRSVEAMCGPVGDCNAVQSSSYARLFGLPVGVLGMLAYLLILAAWAWKRLRGDKLSGLAIFILAASGTLFSIYLTYLELFVIRAVCLWCLASAVIIALLLLLSLPAVRDGSSARNILTDR